LRGQRGRHISLAIKRKVVTLIDAACTSGAPKITACQSVGIDVRTYARWKQPDGLKDKRSQRQRTPKNKLSGAQRNEVIAVVNQAKYCDMSPNKIIPALADEGIYIASESTFYRILRAEKMLTHRGKSNAKTHHKPKALVAQNPNQIWSWDISYLATHVVGLFYYLYLILDIYSRKIVAWTVQERESSAHAAALMREACADEMISPEQITLHSDNGSPMKGATMLATLQKLGVVASFSRPAVSNDNPFSEAMFKTLKYVPQYPSSGFAAIAHARAWMVKFVHWYNHAHLHSSLHFITPQQRHCGQDKLIFTQRKQVYEGAKARFPQRWAGSTRQWDLPERVRLNPDKQCV